jgi:hypothetical protein
MADKRHEQAGLSFIPRKMVGTFDSTNAQLISRLEI